jgi:hypothetical protein
MGRALVSVKSGSVNSSQIRDLKGVLEREKAEIGLFVTLEEPSSTMQLEATTAGVYTSALSGRDYPAPDPDHPRVARRAHPAQPSGAGAPGLPAGRAGRHEGRRAGRTLRLAAHLDRSWTGFLPIAATLMGCAVLCLLA